MPGSLDHRPSGRDDVIDQDWLPSGPIGEARRRDFDITVARVADGRLRITVPRPGAKPKIYRAAPGATMRVKLTD